MTQKISEPGYWNGLPAQITCCIIEIIPAPDKPMMWFNAFAGQERQVVEITQDGTTFIIDNQHGEGFFKVTTGMGSPGYGSSHFEEFRLVQYTEPAFWNRTLDPLQLARERKLIEEYQERTNPEEFKKVQALIKGLRSFQSMSPAQQVEHIRSNMIPAATTTQQFPQTKKFTTPNKQFNSVHKKDGKGKR